MNKSIILISLLVSMVVCSDDMDMLSRSWIVSCKPCVNILEECDTCIRGGCLPCVDDIENARCDKCAKEIIAESDNLYCDNAVAYHNVVCAFSCRASETTASPYRNGAGSAQTGKSHEYIFDLF